MPPTITNEKSAYSTSAPGKSPPTSPSVFVFPEKTSHPGVSPPRYGRQNAHDSSSTSSWVSQTESPPKYGEQKTPDSSNTSCFSQEDSSYSPFSPSFEYHVDSATLFGDGEFKSPSSDPKPSCPLERKVEPKVSHRPLLPPNKRRLVEMRRYKPIINSSASLDSTQFSEMLQYPDEDIQSQGSLPFSTPKSTSKRVSPSLSEPPPLCENSISLDFSQDSAKSGNRKLCYWDSCDIVTPDEQEPAQTEFGPDTKRNRLYISKRQQSPNSGRTDSSRGSFYKKRHKYFTEVMASPTQRTPQPHLESDIRKSRAPPLQTPPPQEPAKTEDGLYKRRNAIYMSPEEAELIARRVTASLGLPSEKHHTHFSESQASPSPQTTPPRTTPPPSSPPLSASSAESDKRKSLYSLSDIEDILPPSSTDASASTEFRFDDVRDNDNRRRVSSLPPSYLEDPQAVKRGVSSLPSSYLEDSQAVKRGVSSLPPSYLEDTPALKSGREKKRRTLGISAFKREPKNIKALCCNLAREFSNREPATQSSQNYSGKQRLDTRKEPLRTLASSTFNSFISQPDLVGVMFHSSTTNKPGTLEEWTEHSLKSSSRANQLFASVDCAKEGSLCAKEGIQTVPFYKVYTGGTTVKAVNDLRLL